MPQLAIETYYSQIFWVLLGFAAVYTFVLCFTTDEIEQGLKNRALYIDELVDSTKQYHSEAEKLHHSSMIALENADIKAANSESRLIASFREKNIAEKNALYHDFSQRSKLESSAFTRLSNEAFIEISGDMDVIVSAAIDSLNAFHSKQNVEKNA